MSSGELAFLNTIIAYRKHYPLRGHGPSPWICPWSATVYMYSKLDLSVPKLLNMLFWLSSNSLNSVIYQDLSSFQVNMELSRFPLTYTNKTSEVKNFAKKVLRTF